MNEKKSSTEVGAVGDDDVAPGPAPRPRSFREALTDLRWYEPLLDQEAPYEERTDPVLRETAFMLGHIAAAKELTVHGCLNAAARLLHAEARYRGDEQGDHLRAIAQIIDALETAYRVGTAVAIPSGKHSPLEWAKSYKRRIEELERKALGESITKTEIMQGLLEKAERERAWLLDDPRHRDLFEAPIDIEQIEAAADVDGLVYDVLSGQAARRLIEELAWEFSRGRAVLEGETFAWESEEPPVRVIRMKNPVSVAAGREAIESLDPRNAVKRALEAAGIDKDDIDGWMAPIRVKNARAAKQRMSKAQQSAKAAKAKAAKAKFSEGSGNDS